jgi:hypothetical protein
VSAVSASDAWAVGISSNSANSALTLHWNGTSWKQVTSPKASGATGTILNAVSARAASDIWAAGFGNTSTGNESVVLHSNGTSWTQVTTPNPGGTAGNTFLDGVSANAASDAWAVGNYFTSQTASETLALHWNGTKWTQVTTPNPGGTASEAGNNFLNAVSAPTASDAWAVGYFYKTPNPYQTLILHWNGTSWTRVTSPN